MTQENDYNLFKLKGYINFEPEIRRAGDKDLTVFTVSRKDKNDNYHNFRCQYWGLSRELTKGAYVAIEGFMKESKWEDNSGQKRSQIIFTATSATRLESKPNNGTVPPQVEVEPTNDEDMF